MARLLTRTRTRLAVKRTATKQKSRFQAQKRTHVAGVIAGGLAVVDGQLYGTGADSAGVIDVVNLGRAAAALYVPENGSGSVVMPGGNGGGCGGSGVGTGVTDHGALTGLGDDDHPQYLLANGNRAMTGNLNLGGNDIYNVDELNGHNVDAFIGDIAELQSDVETLQSRTVLGGTGIDSDEVTFGAGSPTVSVDLAGIAGAGLGATASQLYVKTSARTKITSDAVDVNQAAAFTWTGIHKHNANVQSADWSVGLAGWGITEPGAADFQEVTAKYLYARNFVTDLDLAKLGKLTLAQAPGELAEDFTVADAGTFTVFELPGVSSGTRVYEDGDWVQMLYIIRTTGLQFGEVWGTVAYVSTDSDAGTQTYTWTHQAGPEGITIYAGSVAVSFGQSGDSYIHGNAIGSNAPRWDLIRWTTDPSDGANHDILVRLGKLDGTPSDYFTPTDDGIYAKAAWIEGSIAAASGEVAITDDGVNIAAYSSVSGVPLQNRLTFSADPLAPARNNIVTELWSVKTAQNNYGYMRTHVGTGTNADQGQAIIDVYDTEAGYPLSRITLNGGDTTGMIFSAQKDASTPGTFQFQGGAVEWINTHATANQVIRPSIDKKADLGDNSHWYENAYINTIYTNSVLGTAVDGHHHEGEYITPAELAVELGAYALSDHDHDEYALGSYVDSQIATRASASAYNAHVADTSIHAEIDDASIAATKLWSAQKINTVTSLLASASWVTSQLAAYATSAALTSHTSDDAIHFEINDAGTAADEVWSADKITTVLGDYALASALTGFYTKSEVDVFVAALATATHTHTAIENDLAITGNLSVTGQISGATGNITSYLVAPVIRGNDDIVFAANDGTELVEVRNDGTLRSLAPEYSTDGDGGWELTPTVQRFTNIVASGSISSSIYEYQQVQVGMGSQLFTKGGGGKLKSEFRIDSADTSAVEMDIEDPEAGHIQLFEVGDVLRLRGLGTSEPRDSGASYDAILPGLAWIGADQTEQTAVRDVWLEVVTVIDNTSYYTYEVTYAGGHRGVFRFQAGRAVANYGQDGDGGVEISADQDGAPWIKIFRLDLSSDTPATIPTVLTGRLDVLPFIVTEQYGQALGVNLNDSTAARLVASDQGISAYKLDYTANDGTNNTVSISSSGRVKFGTNVDSAGTTAFDFNPAADTLNIDAVVTLLEDSQIAGDLTLISGATFLSTDLDQNPSTYSWWMNPQGLRFDVSAGGLEEDDTVADYSAGSGTYTPRIEFYDGLWLTERATLRTITDSDGGDYGGGVISTDLVAHPDSTGYEVGVRLMAAADYGAAAQASIGVFYREDNVPRAEVSAGVFDVTALMNVNGYTALNGGALINLLNSYLILNNVPTSSSGLPSGAVWSNSGVLTIVS